MREDVTEPNDVAPGNLWVGQAKLRRDAAGSFTQDLKLSLHGALDKHFRQELAAGHFVTSRCYRCHQSK
jgi:hypothetical protein